MPITFEASCSNVPEPAISKAPSMLECPLVTPPSPLLSLISDIPCTLSHCPCRFHHNTSLVRPKQSRSARSKTPVSDTCSAGYFESSSNGPFQSHHNFHNQLPLAHHNRLPAVRPVGHNSTGCTIPVAQSATIHFIILHAPFKGHNSTNLFIIFFCSLGPYISKTIF